MQRLGLWFPLHDVALMPDFIHRAWSRWYFWRVLGLGLLGVVRLGTGGLIYRALNTGGPEQR